MANSLTPVEQINKYEYTADKVLKMLQWDDAHTRNTEFQYRATQDLSSSALTAYKRDHGYKNTQLCAWKIQRKRRSGGGQWQDVPRDEVTSRLSTVGLNTCATTLDNGMVVIFKPADAGDLSHIKPNERVQPSSTPIESGDIPPLTESGGMTIYYDVVGFKSNDEEWMQKLKFAQMCLLKECYEWTGHIF